MTFLELVLDAKVCLVGGLPQGTTFHPRLDGCPARDLGNVQLIAEMGWVSLR